MKTIMLFAAKRFSRKGYFKPKQVGLATANFSAMNIHDYRKAAQADRGLFYIVDADNVEHARQLIQAGNFTATHDEGRTILIGCDAVRAVVGSIDSISKWDTRVATQGRVTNDQSKALK